MMKTATRHSWINFPNNGKRKCTKCGVIMRVTTKDKSTHRTYEKNGIVSESFIDCIDNIVYQNR